MKLPPYRFCRPWYAFAWIILLAVTMAPWAPAPLAAAHPETSIRRFEFHYRFELPAVPEGREVQLWIPVPQSGPWQSIRIKQINLPGSFEFNCDETYGNRMLYCRYQSRGTPEAASLVFKVQRREAVATQSAGRISRLPRDLFLQANRLVPIDGQPATLLAGKNLPTDPTAAARTIYDFVLAYMTYDKSNPGYGNGDVLWACDSQTGNCSDFHSLFISLTRQQNIPARFEIGFPIADEPAATVVGYHCWAWFQTRSKHWVPVDISEADKHPERETYNFGNLAADRVAFSVGRDIVLKPPAQIDSINFFIYPHVEVDGEPLDRNAIKLQFSYADTPADSGILASPND